MAISRFDLTQPPGPRMSRCVVRDNTVYLAGLTASDATQDIKGQTKQILDKIDGYLAQAGTSKSNLLSANLWIKDMALFADMNSVWNAWVDPENPPARACVKADLARAGGFSGSTQAFHTEFISANSAMSLIHRLADSRFDLLVPAWAR